MDLLKSSALCLIAAAAAGTLATVIVPRGSMDKTVRAVVGVFVVAVICSPIAGLSETDSIEEAFAHSFEITSDNSYTEDMQKQITGVFEREIISCIEEIVYGLNVNVISIKPEISVDENYCINIHKITVTVSGCDSSLKKDLSEKISEKLGAPAEIIAE